MTAACLGSLANVTAAALFTTPKKLAAAGRAKQNSPTLYNPWLSWVEISTNLL